MKIISFDVGIKNLAFCLFEKSSDVFNITKWDTIDISTTEEKNVCQFIEKNIECGKPSKFKKDDKCYCLKHSKKQSFQIPKQEQKMSFINKQKLQKLYEIADNHNIKYDPKIKKTNLIELINTHINNNYFQPIEMKKAAEVNLYNIGLNIKTKLNKLLEKEERIDYVIIENQIGPIANRMKTIQGMIVQYFIMSHIDVTHIEFISATNKLKLLNNKENNIKELNNKENNIKNTINTYSNRKKQGIEKCLEIISSKDQFKVQVDYFKTHKKKDDLSDSFLQGIWFIEHQKL